MAAKMTVNGEPVSKEAAQAALMDFFERNGIRFEYIHVDGESWEMQFKVPGYKAIIRPTQIGRDMNFDIIFG